MVTMQHTAYMLVLAETLAEMKDSFTGKVVVIHQPAEEVPPGGAKAMIENGVLDGVDHVLGVHVMSTMKTGNVYYRPGYVQTGRAFFKLKVQGKGGHGSSPHMANDAIVAGSYFVTALQTVVSRRLSPFETGVVTIGSFDGKGQFNVIKDVVEIEGDVRGLTDATKATIEKEIKRLSKGLEALYGVTCTLEYNDDYPALYNDPEFTEYVAKTLKEADLELVSKYVNHNHLQKTLHTMLRNDQVPLFIQVQLWKMVKFTHIIILNLTFQKNHYLFRQKL